jgi:DNA-directed RNA polymerase I subunit RPA1
MKQVDINRYICKLRLIHYGLLPQADEIDDIVISKRGKAADASGRGGDISDESSEESADEGNIIPRRIAYVNHCIRQRGGAIRPGSYARGKTESMTAKRAAAVRDFLATVGKGQKCARCGRWVSAHANRVYGVLMLTWMSASLRNTKKTSS